MPLANPASGAHNVVVTLSGTRSFAVGVTTFFGVDVSSTLTSALGTFASASNTTGTTASVDVTATGGEIIYDAVAAGTVGATVPGAFTPSPGSQVWTQLTYSNDAQPRRLRAAGSTTIATATTTTVTGTKSNSTAWAIGAVPIRPVKRDQTGVLAYVLNGSVKLAAAWGQDPLTATNSAPGLDVGTSVPPMPEFSDGKASSLAVDNDSDGYISPGDVLTYTITAYNICRLPVPDVIIRDTIPPGCDYVPNSTYKGATRIPDNTTGTPFPLDPLAVDGGGNDGTNVGTLAMSGSVTVTFRATIKSYQFLSGATSILNGGSGYALGVTLPVKDTTKLRGQIGRVVWWDQNGNGIRDAGEREWPG